MDVSNPLSHPESIHPSTSSTSSTQQRHSSEVYKVLLQFSLVERTELIQQFRNLYKKKLNRLTYSEFVESVDLLYTPLHDHLFYKFLFLAFQGKEKYTLTDFEYMSNVGTLIRGNLFDRIKFGFSLTDLDKDGFIMKEELVALLFAMYNYLQELKIPADQQGIGSYVDKLFGLISEAPSSKLNYNQFYKLATTHPKLLMGIGLLHPKRDFVLKPIPKPSFKASSRLSVFIGHEHYSLAMNIMIAIRLSSESSKNLLNIAIQPSDFSQRVSHKLRGSGREKVEFLDYAPLVFRRLRELAGVSEEEYLLALGIEQYLGNFLLGNLSSLSVKPSDGKSGSLFFYSWNGSYLVKTISKAERRTLLKILPAYYQHLERFPQSLMTRFLGFFKLNSYNFVVMGNLLNSDSIFPPNQIFDLKGSTAGRVANSKKGIMKDLDFTRERGSLFLPPETRLALVRQLVEDSLFLESQNIIDYSLLIGIYDASLTKEFPIDPKALEIHQQKYLHETAANPLLRVVRGVDSNYLHYNHELYYLGIIDILTSYNLKKTAETFVKSFVHDKEEISAVPPPDYGERFRSFTTSLFPESGKVQGGRAISASNSPRTSTSEATFTVTSQHFVGDPTHWSSD